jgi:hypothetical protein
VLSEPVLTRDNLSDPSPLSGMTPTSGGPRMRPFPRRIEINPGPRPLAPMGSPAVTTPRSEPGPMTATTGSFPPSVYSTDHGFASGVGGFELRQLSPTEQFHHEFVGDEDDGDETLSAF